MANKTTAKTVDEKPVTDTPSVPDYNEVVANDKAVQDAKGASSSEVSPQEGIEENDENSEILKDNKKLREDVASGETTVIGAVPGYNQSVIQKPLVKDHLSDRPVYETNEAAMLALAAQGKLSTEAPSDADIEAAKGEEK